jgi:hypothetical protein
MFLSIIAALLKPLLASTPETSSTLFEAWFVHVQSVIIEPRAEQLFSTTN